MFVISDGAILLYLTMHQLVSQAFEGITLFFPESYYSHFSEKKTEDYFCNFA